MKNLMQTLAITGGKGGVGKTILAINLAVAMAKMTKRVVLFDADLSLANIDVLLGLKIVNNISHVLSGERTLQEITVTGPCGITVVPASPGLEQLTKLNAIDHANIIHAFSNLAEQTDVLIVDSASGISNNVTMLAQAAQEVIVVICNEASSIADAYALIKVLKTKYGTEKFSIVSNCTRNIGEGQLMYSNLRRITDKFLKVKLNYLGDIPFDDQLRLSVKQRCAVVDVYPNAPSAKAIQQLARLLTKSPSVSAEGKVGYFFENVINPNLAQENQEFLL